MRQLLRQLANCILGQPRRCWVTVGAADDTVGAVSDFLRVDLRASIVFVTYWNCAHDISLEEISIDIQYAILC